MQHKFSNSDIDNILFGNKVPETKVYPFFQSRNDLLKRMCFTVRLDSRVFDLENTPVYTKLSKLVVSIQNEKLKEKELFSVFSGMSRVVPDLVYGGVKKVFDSWQKFYYDSLPDYAIQNGSKYQWEIAQSIGIFAVMTPPFSSEQSAWIAYASSVYRADEHKFMVDIFEAAKPWMNRELYAQVQKNKENKRENVKFDEQRSKMLQGSFGISEEDKKVIAKLERDQEVTADDLDIIR